MERLETRVPLLRARCDELARLGTGFRACNAPLDMRGNCPQTKRHVELS